MCSYDFVSIFIKIQGDYKHLMCTPEGLVRCKHIIGPYVDVGLALGRQSVLQTTPTPCPHFKTTINGGASFMWLVIDNAYFGQNVFMCCIMHSLLFTWQHTICIKTSLDVFSAFKFVFGLFVFLAKKSRLCSFI